MSNWQQAVRTSLLALVESNSPDAQYLYRQATANRMPWRDLFEDRDAQDIPNQPFVVIETRELVPANWGDANSVYEWPVEVYYIQPRNNVDGDPLTETDVENRLIEWANTLCQAVKGVKDPFWVLETSSDYSAGIPPNAYFSNSKLPMWAIVARFRVICGEAPDPA